MLKKFNAELEKYSGFLALSLRLRKELVRIAIFATEAVMCSETPLENANTFEEATEQMFVSS